ncbi:MAG: hypothetical protein EHM28_10705 [Spirochaetaceae bacterium]|nr:MAG: hypothetical protein EHM28_10705 [Spirochaetaceae bacterium]
MPITALACALLCQCAPSKPGIDPAFAAVEIPSAVPGEKVVLEITGLTGRDASVLLDLETIMRFPRTSFSSSDPWDHKTHEYAGVMLLPLLQRLGMPEKAESIEVIAANNFRASIRPGDLAALGHLLAYSMDGKVMQNQPELVKRGTLAIAINFTANPALDVEVYKNQLVWQAKKIVIR